MARVLRIASVLEGAAAKLVAVVLAVLTAVVIAEVIARYVLNAPIIWSNEVATYLFIYSVFFGGSVALRRGELMDVRLLRARCPVKVEWAMGLLAQFAILGFTLVGTFQSGILILNSFRTGTISPALGIPMLYIYLPIPLGFVLMAFFTLVNLFREVAGAQPPPRTGDSLRDPRRPAPC